MKFKYLVGFLLYALCISCNRGYYEQEVSFVNPHDNTRLSGTLCLPQANTPVPAIVLVHGSGPHGRDLEVMGKHKVFKHMAHYLASKGIAVLRYDKRGIGQSQGLYEPYDLENFSADANAAVDYLKTLKQVNNNKVGAIGLSQGGILTPMMANDNKELNFIVMMAGAGVKPYELFYSSQLALAKEAVSDSSSLTQLKELFDDFWNIISKKHISAQERMEAMKYLRQLWVYIDFDSRRDFGLLDENCDFLFDNLYHHPNVVDFYKYDPSPIIKQVACPVLALNGDKDVQVVADVNLPAIRKCLEGGNCEHFKVVKLKNHNHLFQRCKSGKIAEYKEINSSVSNQTLDLIRDWIINLD